MGKGRVWFAPWSGSMIQIRNLLLSAAVESIQSGRASPKVNKYLSTIAKKRKGTSTSTLEQTAATREGGISRASRGVECICVSNVFDILSPSIIGRARAGGRIRRRDGVERGRDWLHLHAVTTAQVVRRRAGDATGRAQQDGAGQGRANTDCLNESLAAAIIRLAPI